MSRGLPAAALIAVLSLSGCSGSSARAQAEPPPAAQSPGTFHCYEAGGCAPNGPSDPSLQTDSIATPNSALPAASSAMAPENQPPLQRPYSLPQPPAIPAPAPSLEKPQVIQAPAPTAPSSAVPPSCPPPGALTAELAALSYDKAGLLVYEIRFENNSAVPETLMPGPNSGSVEMHVNIGDALYHLMPGINDLPAVLPAHGTLTTSYGGYQGTAVPAGVGYRWSLLVPGTTVLSPYCPAAVNRDNWIPEPSTATG